MTDIQKQASLLVGLHQIQPIPLTVCNPHEAATMAAALEFVMQQHGIDSEVIEEYLGHTMFEHIRDLFLPHGGKCSSCPLAADGGDKLLEGALRKCRTKLFPPCALDEDNIDAQVMSLYFKLLRSES